MFANKKLAVFVAVVMIAAVILAACGPTPEPEVIEKIVTQIVEQKVVETVIVAGTPEVVEKVVTEVVEVEVTPVPEVVSYDQAPDPTTLTLVASDDIAMLDPHLAYEGSSYRALANVIEGLVFYDRESASEFVPWLAEEVPTVQNGGVSADGLTYTSRSVTASSSTTATI
jgi:peptide/nickel transport system substrate-binding protein